MKKHKLRSGFATEIRRQLFVRKSRIFLRQKLAIATLRSKKSHSYYKNWLQNRSNPGTKLRLNEGGFITLIIALILILAAVLFLVYMRVSKASH